MEGRMVFEYLGGCCVGLGFWAIELRCHMGVLHGMVWHLHEISFSYLHCIWGTRSEQLLSLASKTHGMKLLSLQRQKYTLPPLPFFGLGYEQKTKLGSYTYARISFFLHGSLRQESEHIISYVCTVIDRRPEMSMSFHLPTYQLNQFMLDRAIQIRHPDPTSTSEPAFSFPSLSNACTVTL